MTEVRERPLPPAAPPAATPRPPSGRWYHDTFRSLRHRNYLYMWIGLVFTSSGMWMEQVITGWLVYTLTGSPLLVGLVNGLRALPFLVLGPLAGVAGDRMDRKMLLVHSQVAILVLYLIMAAILLLHVEQVWHIFAFSFITGIAWTLNQPIRQAVVPTLVPREDLVNAVALQSVAFNGTRIVGPVVGGLLMVAVGPGMTFLIASLTWLGVLYCTMKVEIPSIPTGARKVAGVWADLVEGFRYVGRNTVVRGMMFLVLVPMLFAMPMMSLLPVVAREVFGGDVRVVGELMAANGAGAVVAALWVASRGDRRGNGAVLMRSGLVMGGSIVVFSLSGNYPLCLAMSLVMGTSSMMYFILNNTLILLAAEPQYQGRVISIYMLSRGLMPLGSSVFGAAAEAIGVSWAIGIGGVISVLLTGVAMATLGRTPEWRALGRRREFDEV